jgi:hypothetical protein
VNIHDDRAEIGDVRRLDQHIILAAPANDATDDQLWRRREDGRKGERFVLDENQVLTYPAQARAPR